MIDKNENALQMEKHVVNGEELWVDSEPLLLKKEWEVLPPLELRLTALDAEFRYSDATDCETYVRMDAWSYGQTIDLGD